MPLGTLDRSPPPLFKQGASASTKLILCSALALFMMVADARFSVARPVRLAIATGLVPLQWLAMLPVRAAAHLTQSAVSVQAARSAEDEARRRLAMQAQRAQQSEQLALENQHLRRLLGLRDAQTTTALAAEVIYDAADPYFRRVVIDKGLAQGVAFGSPVIDETGVVGQVTRVYPLSSEVTLLMDREFTIPVLNTRTGARSVGYGEPQLSGGAVELRFIGANADVQVGDLLTTSGIDGIYPAGLAVARVDKVERRAESGFARIYCAPVARVTAARHVMVLAPLQADIQAPLEDSATTARRKAEAKAQAKVQSKAMPAGPASEAPR